MGSVDDILDKYKQKIESQIESSGKQAGYSPDYVQFKKDMLPEISRYERWVKSLGNLIKIKMAEKDRVRVEKFLKIAHLEVEPSQALTLSIVSMLIAFFVTVSIGVAIYLINGSIQLLFLFLGVMASMFIFYYTYTMPKRLANIWRMKASSQMVPAILYIVVYMKHTSNLERAVEFASQHLEGPLALDFKKIFYDVEIGKYPTIKQSLDSYLESWRDYAPEFIESFHLVESSLYEPSENRRVQILEKSLQVILDGIYEKMLKYSREIRSPLTNIYMLGIILPTLGLALIPLASTLLQGVIQWQHIFILFNFLIPLFVFYLASEILLKRPGGYGESSVLELNPEYKKFTSKKPWITAALISLPFLIIGLLPFIFQIDSLTSYFHIKSDYTFEEIGIENDAFRATKLFEFKVIDGKKIGPFGPLSTLLSLFVPFSIGLFFFYAYRKKTSELIKARNQTKQLEEEFTNSLFHIGNRLGDGIPAEIAFGKVAESTQSQITHSFFSIVNQNIQQMGMPLESAVFDKKRGAITYYPSALIATSMRILVESVKKGLQVAARSLMSISEYVKNIQKINQRLKDLLAEVISDMKSNMTFLAPLLAGIVVGLSTMITLILNKIQTISASAGSEQAAGSLGSIENIVQIFDITKMIPPYFMQISIGIYVIEIIFILTSALVTVDVGRDPLKEKSELSKNLRIGVLLYTATALASILALTVLAAIALGNI